jgi:hypothetical protein
MVFILKAFYTNKGVLGRPVSSGNPNIRLKF